MRSVLGPVAACILSGCIGTIQDPGATDDGTSGEPARDDPAVSFSPHLPEPVPVFTRRLSNRELGNALEALVGMRPEALSSLPPDKQDEIFGRVAQSQTVSTSHVEGFARIADEVSAYLAPERLAERVSGCDPAAPRACVTAFVADVAPRAYRRPLEEGEQAAILALYDLAESHDEGMRLVAHRILRSPYFLYVVEVGEAVPGRPELRRLTDHEMAARLSLGICETLPDDELRRAADAGALHDPADIEAQAMRLLGEPCAMETARGFWAQWLRLEEVPTLERDAERFPEFDAAWAAAMQRESFAFLDHVVWETDGSLADVFAAEHTILDEESARPYGLEVGEPGRVPLPPHRRGILTHPSVLAVTSRERSTAPIQRGVFVLERLLCGELPPPPMDLEIVPPAFDESLTTRERWERHSSDAACSGCHQLIDPVGFAMEDFDAIGRHRTSENGRAIDARGGVPTLEIPNGSIEGAAELAASIAATDELAFCFVRQWLRFTLARLESTLDEAAASAMIDVLRAGGSVRAAMAALVRSESFRHRVVSSERGDP